MIYGFENFEFNTQLCVLQRDGETIPLRPKIYQLLIYLIDHHNHVVSKQELSENVWPGQFISNAAMESAIRLLRRALGDSGREQRIIQTVFGHGYRFIALVSEHAEVAESLPALPTPEPEAPIEGWCCPTCQNINAFGASIGNRFCIECGTPFQALCPQCGEDNPPQAKFCAACGTSLSSPLTPETLPERETTPLTSRSHLPEAERRQLTIMSCDLVDAVNLPSRLELEDLPEVIRAYQDICTNIIQRFDGHIAQYLGTTLLVYFGYPQAHEDDAQRAIRAGLDIIASLGELNMRLEPEKGIALEVRLGIHTGPVIVGSLGGNDRQTGQALGEPPNIAHQIQCLADANSVVISTTTAHLVEGFFVCQDLGSFTFEGISNSLELTRVLRTSGGQSRLDVTHPSNLTPFVNRVAEMTLLRQRWEQVLDNLGQVILISGEAGIGKSRLVQTLTTHLPKESYISLECRCSPYHQQSALYPIIDLLQSVTKWQQECSPAEKLHQLETTLAQYKLPLSEIVPFFSPLLSIPLPADRYPPSNLTPQQHRQKTLEAFLVVVMSLAAQQPVLLVVEDLHWIDPSTLELLTLLVDQAPTTSLGIVLTFRPAFQAPWTNRSYLTHIALSRLPRQQTEQIVTGVTKGKRLPLELLQQVLDKTDGVPLFVEECTKTILESGLLQETSDQYELTAPLPYLAVPSTLQDSLMARLDRLDSAKNTAQLGATIGRQIPYALLRSVSQRDEANLQLDLDRLVSAELVYQQGLPPQSTYVFKHALVQEAAYRSLLKNTQRQYHARTAYVLIEEFPETSARQPELVAYHYTAAELIEQAIPYWQKAGESAAERSANVEAVNHFTNGLNLLTTLPETPEHLQQELGLQLAIGPLLRMIKGHTGPEVEQAYQRAYELSQHSGTPSQRFSALVSLCRFDLNRAKLRTAHELAEQCFALAQAENNSILLQESHRMLGLTSFYQGQPTLSREHLEQSISLYDTQKLRSQTFKSGMESGVGSLALLSWTLWLLGYPDQALDKVNQALNLANQTSHIYSQAFALTYLSNLHAWRQETALTLERSEELITLSQNHGFVQFLNAGLSNKGWSLVQQGQYEDGIELLQQALSEQTLGTELSQPIRLAKLAEAYGMAGKVEQGIDMLDQFLTAEPKKEAQYYTSELYRLKGLMLSQEGQRYDLDLSEKSLRQALKIAQNQKTKSFELKILLNLYNLHKQKYQVDPIETRKTLEKLYTWFTEGFSTQDLKEAQSILIR